VIILLLGVAGSGKTTIGKLLSKRLGWEFADADDYHSAANITKMRNGIPLNDEDRRPWLESLRSLIGSWSRANASAVLACSALKEAYRRFLHVSSAVRFVYLKADQSVILERLRERPNHYMKDTMLASQFAALEEPEDALVIDASRSPAEIVDEIVARLDLEP